MFEDIAAARLRAGGRRFALRNVFMCSAEQPQCPTSDTEAHQQDQHALSLGHPTAFPIEHVALTILEGTLLPPPAGVFGEAFVGRRKIRDNVPDCRPKAFPHELVDADIDPTRALFPDPHLRQIPPCIGALVDAL